MTYRGFCYFKSTYFPEIKHDRGSASFENVTSYFIGCVFRTPMKKHYLLSSVRNFRNQLYDDLWMEWSGFDWTWDFLTIISVGSLLFGCHWLSVLTYRDSSWIISLLHYPGTNLRHFLQIFMFTELLSNQQSLFLIILWHTSKSYDTDSLKIVLKMFV